MSSELTVQKAFSFPHSDDGYLAEGYSEFVVHTLATRWSTLQELTALTRAHPKFAAFILRHVDATTDERELRTVRYLATQRVPRGSRTLCRAIAQAARAQAQCEATQLQPSPRFHKR